MRQAFDQAQVDVIVCVDWTGCNAAQRLLACCSTKPRAIVYFSFCVFSALFGLVADDVRFYQLQEARAMAAADMTLCLCPKDRRLLMRSAALSEAAVRGALPPPLLHVLLPPLRLDMHNLAMASRAWGGAAQAEGAREVAEREGAVRGRGEGQLGVREGEGGGASETRRTLVVCCLRQASTATASFSL